MPQCEAQSKQSGEQCRRHATPGMAVCYYHGSRSLVGPANGNWKGGRYSRVVPASLRASYEAARDDPELLSTREEQALFAARIGEVLSRLDASPGVDAMLVELRRLRESLTVAVEGENLPEVLATVGRIDALLDRSAQEERIWRELASLAETRRKLADTERKRLEALEASLSATEATALVHRLIGIIADRVDDRRVIGAIASDFRTLLGPGE